VHQSIPGTHVIDLEHQGRRKVIGASLVEGAGGCVLVDPGPASTLATLLAGLALHGWRLQDVAAVLLTHIHLDHAGVTGALVARHPGLRVLVHARGAAHVEDPSRLLQSARRLWGTALDGLWGEPSPVPAHNLETLSGGEVVEVVGRRFEVADTPGHASHHVCYFEAATGTVFAGDTAGVRIAGTPLVTPPTPPPDIDVAAWERSLETLLGWRPARLVMTHFGAVEDVAEHVSQLRARLGAWSELVRGLLAGEETEEERSAAFVKYVEREVRSALDEETATAVLQATPPELSWPGLARYWRKREPSPA
jgi:glyoxylase-like metal-dependent hydrolase (beta-lactamase superfamily II)